MTNLLSCLSCQISPGFGVGWQSSLWLWLDVNLLRALHIYLKRNCLFGAGYWFNRIYNIINARNSLVMQIMHEYETDNLTAQAPRDARWGGIYFLEYVMAKNSRSNNSN